MQHYEQYTNEHGDYYNEENIVVTLHNQDLWNQFHQITNEMIVTKVGRRMFPIISIRIRGLDPDKMYTVELSFEQVDSHRWRFSSSQWQPGMKPDPAIKRPPYQHPDSPNYGRTWMKDVVSFPKVKLTNKIDHTSPSQVILNSLHKYRPKISIIDVMSKRKIYETSFDETEFIAVTAYQSEEVKALKIRYNPFAKAFLDTGNVKREMEEEQVNNGRMFCTQESSSGGPDRIKLQSHRSSPYNYVRPHCKISPVNALAYPSASSSPSDIGTFYNPTGSVDEPCSSSSPSFLSDANAYYQHSYYPQTSPYYFPYGGPTPGPMASYGFMTPFNYGFNSNANFGPAASLPMQQTMSTTTSDYSHVSPLLPTTSDIDEY